MTDPRAGKIYYFNWPQWEEFCNGIGENSEENESFNFDLGGGNYYTVALKGEKDE